jgi:hypothetical protein
MHAYATGVDEVSPFMVGVGGTCTRSGTISDATYVEINFWNDGGPYYTVEPPYGADLLSFCLTANSLGTTTAGQVSFNLSASKSDFSPFYNSTNILDSSLQSSTGNGGGIGLRVDGFVTQDYDSDQTYRRIFFNSATISRGSSTVIGYAAMSFILRGKKAKGANFSDMVAFSSEATVSVTKTSVGGIVFPGQDGEAALLLESSIAASVSKGLLQAVSEGFASDTGASGRRDAFAEILEGHTASATLSGGKSAASGIAFSLDSLLTSMPRKSSGGAFSDQLDSDIFFIVSKASARDFMLALSSSVWSQGRVVTAFEYGDMVVVDLRAVIPALDHSCVRGEDVLQSRRNLEAELSAMRGLPQSDARRRALDVFCAGPRILGTEIVCVREVFNEGE